MADEKKKILDLENDMETELYDINDKDQKEYASDLGNIEDAVNKIRHNGTKFTGEQLLDFLTQMDFNTDKASVGINPEKRKSQKSQIEQVLSNENISQLMDFERERISRYEDYNLIYSYIPQLAEAVNVFRDSIMSPDDLTKNALEVSYKGLKSDSGKNVDIDRNLKSLVKKYKLNGKAKNIIRKALTMGDYFVAVLKYDNEFNRLLSETDDSLFINKNEKTDLLLESSIEEDESFKYMADTLIKESNNNATDSESPNNTDVYNNIKKDITRVLNDNIEYEEDPRNLLRQSTQKDVDKLMRKKQKRGIETDEESYGFKGSIIRLMEPANVIKLEVDGINFGYIYIEKSNELLGENEGSAINDFFDSRVDIEKSQFKDREEVITNIFVKGISKKIDNDIVKDNQEFKDYIYTLLKQKYITEKAVKITYLTPEEVVPFIIEGDGIYGQSILSRSLFFAKLYLATLITELMQKISRGRDKRMIYVETGLDADIEGVIQGVVKDIKSKEIQTDVLKSITTILNNIGVFDDYYIPLIDGEKPLDFDTLQGMDVDADNEFLQFLLKSAITGTGVPVNYIDATQEVDFARTLVMQNSSFVRSVVVHQSMFAEAFSDMLRILYKNEYVDTNINQEDKSNEKVKTKTDSENVDINEIYVTFPVPISLNLNNVNDQISNSSQTLDFITSVYIDDTDTDTSKKVQFRKKVVRDLMPNIDWESMDALYESAMVENVGEKLKEKVGASDEDEEEIDDSMF